MNMQTEIVIPNDLAKAVRDIKLAILQARARVARVSNVEALKLYFYVGGYVSKKTRSAKWGTGAINALSERLQVELPGLRGFSVANIKYMRIFFEAWARWFEIRQTPSDGNGVSALIPVRQTLSDELDAEKITAFLSLGFSHHTKILLSVKNSDERWFYITSCAKNHWSYAELTAHLGADDYHHIGALPNSFIKTLAPVIDGVRKLMVESACAKSEKKGCKKAK